MTRVLILSSYVAASRVGGAAQALALARLGIDPILIPTVLFGRHPGHGPPGGGAVEPAMFRSLIDGVVQQAALLDLDAMITGYFASAEQVAIAAELMGRVRATCREARIIVDPIMGDESRGLYVREPVAQALAEKLAPDADFLAPNAWELARLRGAPVKDPASAVAAARAFGRPTIVSSVTEGGLTGAVYATATEAWFAGHEPELSAPSGTGDLMTAIFTAALTLGRAPQDALALAVGAAAEAVAEAQGWEDLPFSSLPTALTLSPRVTLRAL